MTMAIGASAHRRLFAGRLRFSFMPRKYIHDMGKQSEHHRLRILHLLSYVFYRIVSQNDIDKCSIYAAPAIPESRFAHVHSPPPVHDQIKRES